MLFGASDNASTEFSSCKHVTRVNPGEGHGDMSAPEPQMIAWLSGHSGFIYDRKSKPNYSTNESIIIY